MRLHMLALIPNAAIMHWSNLYLTGNQFSAAMYLKDKIMQELYSLFKKKKKKANERLC